MTHNASPIPVDFETLVGSTLDAVIVGDARGRITYVNPAAARLLGYAREDLVGHDLTTIMPERYRSAHAAGMRRYLQTREPRLIGTCAEMTARHKNGDEIPIELSLSAHQNQAETYFVGVLRDIRHRQQSEKSLAVSEERWRSVVQNSPDIIIVADREGTIQFINRVLSGFEMGKVVGTKVYDYLTPKAQETVRRALNRVFDTGKTVPYEVTGPGPGLIEIYYSCVAGPIRQEEKIVAVIITSRDITRRKQREDDLKKSEAGTRQAYDELLQLQGELLRTEQTRALGDMAAGVAHQFNNVLMMISGLVELAQMHAADRKRLDEYLEKIKISTADGSHIVQRLQAFIRRSPSLDPQAVQVNEVIQASVQLTQPKWKDEAEKRGVHISLRTDLHPVPNVEGLESELREVIVNLILNAVDAMPMGGDLSIGTADENGKAVIRVRDTGIGMSSETQSKLFVPFFSTKVERGTGLGLFICRNIVAHMKGTISVDSTEGEGATFTLELPPFAGPAPVKKKETTKKMPVASARARILAVDDEAAICEILKEFLKVENHDVVTFTDPRKAIEAFSGEPFDLVITDLGMAPLNGWDVLKAVKRIRPRTRTILLTGWGTNIEPAAATAQGADVILSKPIEMKQLLKIVQRILAAPSTP